MSTRQSMSRSHEFELGEDEDFDFRNSRVDTSRPFWSHESIPAIANAEESSPKLRRAPVPRPPLPLPVPLPRHTRPPPVANNSSPRPTPRPPPPPLPPHRANPHMGVGSLHPARNRFVQPLDGLQPTPVVLSDKKIPLLCRLQRSKGVWYFPDMNRYLAQFLLRFAPIGSFIVRKGSQEQTLALTVRNKTDSQCDHYRIFVICDGYQVEGSLLVFKNLELLIEYYSLHLRELPYLLRLPDPIKTCPSIPLLDKFSEIATAFWSAFYPRPMDEALADTHRNALALNTEASSDTGIGTSGTSNEVAPRSSYLDIKDPRLSYLLTKGVRMSNYLAPTEGPLGMSGASSVDSLLRSSDDRSATSDAEGTGSSCGVQLTTNTSTSRSAEDLCQAGNEAPSSFRSSVTVRVGRSQSDAPHSYDAVWNTTTGAQISSSSSAASASANPPPVTPPQEGCPLAPPSDFDLAHVSYFPHPDRFKPRFTFDGYTPRTTRRGLPPPAPPRSPPSASDIYEDPLDLRLGAAAARAAQRRGLVQHVSVPIGGSLPPNLRSAVSDDSLSRRVEPYMAQIHDSVTAMEAELGALTQQFPPLPPHARVALRTRPIPLHSDDASPQPPAGPSQANLRQRRDSFYDNVSPIECTSSGAHSLGSSRQASLASSRGTVFSAPWENSLWHQVLHPAARGSATSMDALRQVAAAERLRRGGRRDPDAEESDGDVTPTLLHRASPADNGPATPTKGATLGPDDVLHSVEEPDSGHYLVRKAQARISEFIQPSGGRNVGASIDRWLQDLMTRQDSMFGQKVASFIECTRDAHEKNPHAVMRNIRQFMDGLKNYLVQRDETGFHKVVENERKKLAPDEFLNVERRLESALYNLILRPLKAHVDRLVSEWEPNTDSLHRIRENIHLAAQQTPERLGIRSGLHPPKEKDLTRIRQHFAVMEAAYSPLVKLESLLKAVEIMYDGNEPPDGNKASPQLVSADEYYLMPIFTYVLVRCELYNAEFEADYMQGLLASKFLLGEGAYYLSTLQASVQVIKNFHRRSSIGPITSSYEDLSQLHGVLRVIVLDERTDSTNIKTFPARPTMTARDLSILIAHRCHIFNPQDYGLYHFANGKERHLKDLDLPQQIKVACETRSEKPCHLLYRRTNGVFALPLGLSCGR